MRYMMMIKATKDYEAGYATEPSTDGWDGEADRGNDEGWGAACVRRTPTEFQGHAHPGIPAANAS